MQIDLTAIPYLAQADVIQCLRSAAQVAYAQGVTDIYPKHMIIPLAKATNTWSEPLEDSLSNYSAVVATSSRNSPKELRVSEPLKQAIKLASENAQGLPINPQQLWGACILTDREFLGLYQRCYNETFIHNLLNNVTTLYFGKPYTIRLPCLKLRATEERV